jgi:hypothetical protein
LTSECRPHLTRHPVRRGSGTRTMWASSGGARCAAAATHDRILLGPIAADISFGVIHDRAKRPRAARRSEVVNNSAVDENSVGGRPASARSRSYRSDPQRIKGRLPGEPEAFAKTSNRTKPQEGHYISSMDGRAKGRQHQKKRITAMNNPSDQESGGWLESRGFGALDWASEKHSVVVVDPQGNVLEDFEIEHSALGWKKFRERMRPYGSIPFAIGVPAILTPGKAHRDSCVPRFIPAA